MKKEHRNALTILLVLLACILLAITLAKPLTIQVVSFITEQGKDGASHIRSILL